MADEYGSVSSTIEADKKKMLEAAATGGSAGVAAFKQGQEALAAGRQASVARAAQLSGLIGGPEAQGFDAISNRQYDRGIANLGTAQATFSADMDRRSGAFNDYLSKAQASVPAYRAETDRLIGLKQAAADAKAAKEGPDVSIQGLLGLASQAKTAAQPISAPGPVDFGAPQQPNESITQYLARLNTAAQGRRDAQPQIDEAAAIVKAPQNELAAQIGRTIGVPDTKLAELYGPTVTKSLETDAPKGEIAKALATKYDTKGVDYPTAERLLASPDFKAAATDLQTKASDPAWTREEVDAHLRTQFLLTNPQLYYILAGEYLSLFPTEE